MIQAMNATATSSNGTRMLNSGDIERVIAIDRAHSGRVRRHFFEKRFAAAAARPDEFIQIGVVREGILRGFAIARLLRGEFGRKSTDAVLDTVAVEIESQEVGVGHALMEGLVVALRGAGVRTLQSQSEWKNTGLLRYFAASGFELAHRLVLERSVSEPLTEQTEDV
jgi:L-amino acid N-acyltransferase YncA